MADSSISVVPIGTKVCKPFLLEVMVFSPESGYKFKVVVERSCTPEADPIWKLVFDLFRVAAQEVQFVHVSFTTGTPVEQKAVQRMASDGVTASGPIELVISGLTPGRHSLATYHNRLVPTQSGRITISADGGKAITIVELQS